MRSSVTVGLGLALVSLLVGCKSKPSTESAPVAASAVATTPTALPVSPAATAVPSPRLPEGPALAILAGKGVGSIRIGATVATIERLMGVPCEVKRDDLCRYVRRAVEFHLDKSGATDRITVHRHERPAGINGQGQPMVYGFFNGAIPPGAALGMIPSAIIEFIGQPTRAEPVDGKNDNNTIERTFYPGLTLEFDRYTNGKVMLGGVIIEKDAK